MVKVTWMSRRQAKREMDVAVDTPMGSHIRQLVCWGSALLLLGSIASSLAGNDQLRIELAQLDELRTGKETPFALVEERAKTLLERYQQDEDRGMICFQVAHAHAQSGHVIPAKTIEYAQKALDLLKDPRKRQQLYIYMGDAMQLSRGVARGKSLAEVRRAAFKPYLAALKESIGQNIPDEAPELPQVNRFFILSSDAEVHAQAQRTNEQQMKARKLAEFQCDMVEMRQSICNLVVYMYSRFPFATEELERLARETLGDHQLVASLVAQTKQAIQERVKGSELDPQVVLDHGIASIEDSPSSTSTATVQTNSPPARLPALNDAATENKAQDQTFTKAAATTPWRVGSISAAVAAAIGVIVWMRSRRHGIHPPR